MRKLGSLCNIVIQKVKPDCRVMICGGGLS